MVTVHVLQNANVMMVTRVKIVPNSLVSTNAAETVFVLDPLNASATAALVDPIALLSCVQVSATTKEIVTQGFVNVVPVTPGMLVNLLSAQMLAVVKATAMNRQETVLVNSDTQVLIVPFLSVQINAQEMVAVTQRVTFVTVFLAGLDLIAQFLFA